MQISSKLSQLSANVSADQIQHALYDIARPVPRYQDHSAKGATASRPGVSNEFFNMIYAVLLGEDRGPRLGSFIAIYGLDETRKLIDKALTGKLVSEGQTRGLALRGATSRKAATTVERASLEDVAREESGDA
jgi:lysyl-tRNA synthetase, class I